MLALGIVERVNSEFSVKVRIPVLHRAKTDVNATPTDLLPDATVCSFTRSYPNYVDGSVVVVGFDRNDLTSPIVLGELLTEKNFDTENCMSLSFLNVDESCTLPNQTTIGEVNEKEISCLLGINNNIQYQLDEITRRVSALESEQ